MNTLNEPGISHPSVGQTSPRPDTSARVGCELCGCDLPDTFADDAFPVCGICAEELIMETTQENHDERRR